ncbi:MAG TPA: histidine kinase dimerization/phospho-acceptor domain-containing protein [Thermoanaerobaculia bacterium]|nr:histidine kinase dimerization/phospho-acceptor domain-containing protein [Thermoanaerobaculia bacterium]
MDKWLEQFARANFTRSADTAHDLKTPLNVAVLNLELLRVRIRNLTAGNDDPKIIEYTKAIELELRRMARIFDTFFLLSTPPRGLEAPTAIDVMPIFVEAAAAADVVADKTPAAFVIAHEVRIREAFKLFFEGALKLFPRETVRAVIRREAGRLEVAVAGVPQAADFEPTKLFKFYYTDPLGNPELSLSTARLIVETYGGGLNATEESDKVVLRLTLPLGEE